jgi:hypothetical protein
MDRALLFLLWLRLASWMRRLGRRLRTVRGLLLALLGLLVCLPCLLSLFLAPRSVVGPTALEHVRQFGPFALLGYCVLSLSFTSAENFLPFTAAEVNFLFCGPFSRRQLLAYKLAGNVGMAFVSAGIFLLAFRLPTPSFLAGYVGILLSLLFVQFFPLALGLLGNTIGARAYSRGRKFALALIGIALLGAVLYAARDWQQLGPVQALQRVEQTPWLHTALEPLRWFILALTAEHLWPDLCQWGALALAVDLGLLLLIFALDAQYLESSAAASERMYARLQQIRSGGVAAISRGRAGDKPRLRLPLLPWWGGAGPIAWRQLTTALRSRAVVLLVLILGIACATPLAVGLFARNEKISPLVVMGPTIGFMTLFLNALVAFDFRSDLDRMDVLKTLPLSSVALAFGQLIAPTLVVCLVQWLALVVLALAGSGFELIHLAFAALAVPFNFFVFGLENLTFLVFPTRLVPTTPGDIQTFGRQLLLTLLRMVAFGITGGTTALFAVLVYFASGRNLPAALAAAWVVLAGFAVGQVPLVALAFRKYDVARDTPP